MQGQQLGSKTSKPRKQPVTSGSQYVGHDPLWGGQMTLSQGGLRPLGNTGIYDTIHNSSKIIYEVAMK